ncbi:uncharacterized protein LOC134830671 isoform X1 [Culicoides brevitarsis]|uniref:uncharacterized protein LOC134830671 isoform X1 n=1 Tax=Culicoides brevitarsis TaxID=469753 RepID=UPI00307B3FBB
MENSADRCSLQDILDFGNNDVSDDSFRITLQSNVQNLHQICRQLTEMMRHQSKQTENKTFLKHDEVESIKEFQKQSSEYLVAIAELLGEKKKSNKNVVGLNNARNLKSEMIRLLNTAKAELKVTDDVMKALEKMQKEWEMLDLD